MKSGEVDQAKPPRFFYGWVVVAAAFCVALVAYGVQYSFGIFIDPLTEYFGGNVALVTGAASLFMFSRGALAIFTGWVTDRYGPSIIVAIGGLFLGLGIILVSQISAAWQLYLFYGLMGGFALSVAYAPLMATVSRWFVSKRGLAIGIVAAGIGAGTAVMSPLAAHLVATYEWRLSYIIIGLLALIIIIPGAFLLRRSPEEKGLLPLGKTEAKAGDEENSNIAKKESSLTSERAGLSLRDAARTRAFWLLLAIIIFWSICVQMVMINIVYHAIKGLGIPDVVAANPMIVIGISSIIGRLAMGAVSDRLGGKRTLVICLVLQALAMFWLLRATDIWMLYLFAAAFGFAYGGCVPLLPVIAGEIFELKSIGAIVGVQMLGVAIGGAIGPVLGGYVFVVTHSYYLAFTVGGICTVIALILLAFIRAPRKVSH